MNKNVNCRESLLDNKQNGAPAISIVHKLSGGETHCARPNMGVFLPINATRFG